MTRLLFQPWSECIRTNPNKFRGPAGPINAGRTRKNLKKAESPEITISSVLREIATRSSRIRPEKNFRPKPEKRPRPALAQRSLFHPQVCRSTAKTTPKLTKTIHPDLAISRKTLGGRPIRPAAEKIPATLSTLEARP
jgi:hypothetical protein